MIPFGLHVEGGLPCADRMHGRDRCSPTSTSRACAGQASVAGDQGDRRTTCWSSFDAEFERLYEGTGRQSIAPEQLLRASLLQAFYSVRSERQLMEQIDYNLLFRWFVGLGIDAFARPQRRAQFPRRDAHQGHARKCDRPGCQAVPQRQRPAACQSHPPTRRTTAPSTSNPRSVGFAPMLNRTAVGQARG